MMNWMRGFLGDGGAMPPQRPLPAAQRPFLTYGAIPAPSYPQFLEALFCLDRIFSELESVAYCLVGPIVACTQGSDIQVQIIDVLLDKAILENNARRFYQILDTHCRYLTITESDHLIVILADNNPWGVAVKPWFTESRAYPYKLIPPREPGSINPTLFPESTFRRRTVRGAETGSKQLPMLRWHHLLHQRLLHLEEHPTDPVKLAQMERYIYEIRAFLYFATTEREGPFLPHEVGNLQQKIDTWIRMSRERGQTVSPNDHAAWLLILGLPITWLHLGMVGGAGF